MLTNPWDRERVATSVRLGTMRKLATEIDFAFRVPPPNAQQTDVDSGAVSAVKVIKSRAQKKLFTQLMQDQRESRLNHLIWDVNDLRQEVRNCEELRSAQLTWQSYRNKAATAFISAVVASFFANGLQYAPPTPPIMAAQAGQLEFLRTVMHEDLVIGSVLTGIDEFVEQRRRYSEYFGSHAYRMISMETTSLLHSPIVTVHSSYRIRISNATFKYVFPHVMGDDFFQRTLVGQEIHCSCRMTLHLDEDGRIIVYDDETDFVAAFMQVIPSVVRLAKLMDGARIHFQSLLGDVCITKRGN